MRSGAFVLVNGCSGSYAAPSQNRPVFSEEAPRLVEHEPFRREVYGGLTTALLVGHLTPAQDIYFLLDHGLGSGPRAEYLLGMIGARGRKKARIHVLLSHYHWDHIEGVLADLLLFESGLEIIFHSPDLSQHCCPNGSLVGKMTMEQVLANYFREGYSPVTLELLDRIGASRQYSTFTPGESFLIDGTIKVDTMLLKHPNGCCGYGLNIPGAGRIVFATDYEPPRDPDAEFTRFSSGAVWFYGDLQFDDPEYRGEKAIGHGRPRKLDGWGHGTPELLFGQLLNCDEIPRILCLGHHDPRRSDARLRLFEEKTQVFLESRDVDLKKYPMFFAREGAIYWL